MNKVDKVTLQQLILQMNSSIAKLLDSPTETNRDKAIHQISVLVEYLALQIPRIGKIEL